ncbi:hypothetical protein P280DRAFT_470206 [Massarina eburnea CBS 473.64]|uniref:Uncharacterized protein n=1 Tax=Massarina eburnea CBS 473.64 TaxID=1395130 RepID=A0A6A6RZF4_9PLEO|nr:hypothetical protein P280DRAFT_470206 [Massarina eburnea CBS 473.64]
MKFSLVSSVLVVLMATAAVVAVPAPGSEIQALDNVMGRMLAGRDSAQDCNECNEHLDICMTYGFGPSKGIVHCAEICKEYLCRKWPDCRDKGCGGNFDGCHTDWH